MNCEICGGNCRELYSCSRCAALICDADYLYYEPHNIHYCENCVIDLEESEIYEED